MQQSQLKVLLISGDESDFVRTSRALAKLANSRWHLNRASRLSDGIKQLGQEETAVVLLDLYLPDSQGSKTFKNLYAAESIVPIVVLTSREDQVIGWHTTRCGAADHLLKDDIDEYHLAQTLDGVIQLNRSQHQSAANVEHNSDKRYRTSIGRSAESLNSNVIRVVDYVGRKD